MKKKRPSSNTLGEVVGLKTEDWVDVADLCEQGAAQAEVAGETHTRNSIKIAVRWLNQLAMRATRKANAPDEARRSGSLQPDVGATDQKGERE
jgi:hypothetical protein